jgi:L-serine/L-threonine ammonia-lyase
MPLHIDTPLLRSTPLSQRTGADIWLKMDALQPSGSFKMRGMSRAAERAQAAGARHLVSSSGGNAGLAVACAGAALGLPVTIVVPRRTSESMRRRIEAEGARVIVHGEVWDDAHQHAMSLDGALIHPFDHPDVWDGHASLVHEVAARGLRPDVLLVSVGGGGLLIGLMQGLEELGWSHTRVLAVETEGADSFARAVEAGGPVTRPSIDSVALTLGAKRVADEAFAWSQRRSIEPVRVTDRAAVQACASFLDDHRILVEPACGAALSLVYGRDQRLSGDVLVVVCGGASADREQLAAWQAATL